MLPDTAHRVERLTSPSVNGKIRQRTEASIAYYAVHAEKISERLRELDREWDIERILLTMSSGVSVVGLIKGALGKKRWFMVPVIVQSFMVVHALQGWCPPLPILRRLGFRTSNEIETEKYALKALRGDFETLPKDKQNKVLTPVLAAVRK